MSPPTPSTDPQDRSTAQGESFRVALFYKYVALGDSDEDVARVAAWQRQLCESLALFGRIRVAREGINGTLGGAREDVDAYISRMESCREFVDAQGESLFAGIDWKTSESQVPPFHELLVRVTHELVALELPDEQCDLAETGLHLSPAAFRDVMLASTSKKASESEVIAVIDVRNAYEFSLGHFDGALNPKTRRFGQFPDWVRASLPALQEKDKVLMYCTGGIRCEKASAFLKHLGVRNVFQLRGGIHRFLEQFPDGGGVFRGKNFVFDERVAVSSSPNADGIIPGGIAQPIAQPIEAVAGRCERCDVPHDELSGARCCYCRMHVLLCDACAAHVAPEDRFCEEHAVLVAGDDDELKERVLTLRQQLAAVVGRGNKGKRRSLRKQLDTVERRIERLAVSVQV